MSGGRRPPGRRRGEALVLVAVGLGSNLGDRRRYLEYARRRMRRWLEDLDCSSIYETEPRHLRAQPRFLNVCCTGRTALAPGELMGRFQAIERAAGRKPGGERYGPRPLDIDLLLYGDGVVRREGLEIPHPRMAERAFVLIPLAEIAPDWMHPELGVTVEELRNRLPADPGVVRYGRKRSWGTDGESRRRRSARRERKEDA